MTDPTSTDRLPPHPVLPKHYATEGHRVRYIRDLFDSTADGYDRINAWMSLNQGEKYRRDMLVKAGIKQGQTVVDVAAGTGVLAAHAQELVGSRGLVIAIDPSLPMLDVALCRGVQHRAAGIAERLPLAEASVDLVSMGYALRHVNDLIATFQEYRRVLRPGGQLMILEMVPPESRIGFRLTKVYLKYLVPALAAVLTRGEKGHRLMRYYWDTIAGCVPPETVLNALQDVGFTDVSRSTQLGILNEYRAKKP
jgi:demethylmenaquinone methyltransferase/2-methoxy-6-polyprenyl-1,4-benzoquinol methylase